MVQMCIIDIQTIYQPFYYWDELWMKFINVRDSECLNHYKNISLIITMIKEMACFLDYGLLQKFMSNAVLSYQFHGY